jgi:hypothetical protein
MTVSFGAALGAAGCAAEPATLASEQDRGTLVLPLLTPTRGAFRLGSAHFVVTDQQGAQAAALDSDADPAAQALTASLPQGRYSALLQDGWVLSSVADDGSESTVRAALLSPNPQSFDIRPSVETDIAYTFATESGTITIGTGPVSITFDVAPNTGTSGCDLTGGGCSFGQACLLADSNGRTFCASPGTLPVGSPCQSEQCVGGSQCLRLDPDHPDDGVCTALCNTNNIPFGCHCISLGIGDGSAGVCSAPGPNDCDLLAQSGCPDGQACRYLGGSSGTCGVPGTTQRAQSCFEETCVAGAQCYGGTCRAFCDLTSGSNNCPYYCQGVGTGNVGRCYPY